MRTLSLSVVLSLSLMSAGAWAGKGSSSAAIKAAVQSGSEAAIVGELERAEYLPSAGAVEVVMKLVDHPSAKVRDAAGWWLTRRGVRTEVLASMTARLTGSDPIAARNAGDVLAAMREHTTVPALGAYLGHPLDEESGAAVARALGAIGHPTAVPALEAALSSPLAGVRAQAAVSLRSVRALSGQKTAASVGPLVALLHDSDPLVRKQAARTIGFIAQSKGDTTGALAALVPVVTDDTVPAVRKAAAWALGELRDGGGRAALTRAQSDADPLVRSIASAALVNLR